MPTRVFFLWHTAFPLLLILITWRYYAGGLTSPSIVFYENTSNITAVRNFLRINSRNQPFIYLQS